MKILFVINDGEACRMYYEYTGILNAPNRRTVEIELTPEQVEKIGLRKVGTDRGRELYETIESVSLAM